MSKWASIATDKKYVCDRQCLCFQERVNIMQINDVRWHVVDDRFFFVFFFFKRRLVEPEYHCNKFCLSCSIQAGCFDTQNTFYWPIYMWYIFFLISFLYDLKRLRNTTFSVKKLKTFELQHKYEWIELVYIFMGLWITF